MKFIPLAIVFLCVCFTAVSLPNTVPPSTSTGNATNGTTVTDGITKETEPTNANTVLDDDEGNGTATTVSNGNSTINNTNSDAGAPAPHIKTWKNFLQMNRGALQRTFYVLIGVSGLVIVYFVVRAFRMKKKRNKSRKYGVITSNNDAALEMEPLDNSDDDDEDEVTTLFEAKSHKRHR